MASGADQPTFDVENAPAPDELDNWCAERDVRETRAVSRRYLPPTVIGYEDLDQYGSWKEESEYGPVWYPREVAVGWAPYHYGHWAWIQPWGWTWIDDASWGFAPFHYGRWAYIGNRWGWCPGPIAVVGYHGPVIRPYYAPALVAWFGGAHWGVSVSLGPSLGWVPLGFGEVYTPAYACSRRYFSNVNVYNTRIVKNVNITNVYNTVYVNKTVYNQQFVNVRAPNAVQAMPQSAFASGRPVHQAGMALRAADLRQVGSAAVVSPAVAPTRQAFLPPRMERPAAHPMPQVMNRQVVAVHMPAAAPAQAPVARIVRPATPVQAQPGQRFGHPVALQPQNGPPQQPVSPMQPRIQTPVQQAARPVPPQPTHGVPPNMRGGDHNSEANRPLPQHPQAPAQTLPHERPMMERPAAVERPAAPRPENHPVPENQHNQAPALHAQPAPPPVNRGEHHDRPPEHNNGHIDHKSQ
jgi:hypothetical protein